MLEKTFLAVGALVSAGLLFVGCGKSPDKDTAEGAATNQVSTSGHSHESWWCDEHGVPEEVDTQCHIKLAADFKAKGDWCKQHDRPDSQCFICHPELQAKFAALYEAKYGKEPPKPE